MYAPTWTSDAARKHASAAASVCPSSTLACEPRHRSIVVATSLKETARGDDAESEGRQRAPPKPPGVGRPSSRPPPHS